MQLRDEAERALEVAVECLSFCFIHPFTLPFYRTSAEKYAADPGSSLDNESRVAGESYGIVTTRPDEAKSRFVQDVSIFGPKIRHDMTARVSPETCIYS